MAESVAFDRAAAYYDRTRGFTPQGERKTIELLAAELAGRGCVVEIGVGTGQVALPLHAAGLDIVGLDLARPMMDRLIEKAGGHAPIPLVQGDATRLPFGDGVFGAAYFRWVLHLIPDWETVMGELVRVVRSGGCIVGNLGGRYEGPRSEIQDRFAEVSGLSTDPAGLPWDGWSQLDRVMERLGTRIRDLPVYADLERDGVDDFMDALRDGFFSWTWSMPEEVRLRAATEVRAWAEARFGPLDQIPRHEHEIVWRAYDLA